MLGFRVEGELPPSLPRGLGLIGRSCEGLLGGSWYLLTN